MANDQGRRHSRKKRRTKAKTVNNNQPLIFEFRFIDTVDDYAWENHVIGRLPFIEPEEVEIVFHKDKLWQENRKSQTFHFLNYLLQDGPRA